MKKATFYGLVFLLPILLVTASCSSMIESITGSIGGEAKEDETEAVTPDTEEVSTEPSDIPKAQDIAGVWINKDYDNDGRSAKLVYTLKSGNTYSYKAYDKPDGSGDVYTGTVTYSKRWSDGKGNLPGKSKVTLEGGMSWETLDRISKDGKTLEVQSGVTEIEPSKPRYSIYYRSK
jgi:hypothetical protein